MELPNLKKIYNFLSSHIIVSLPGNTTCAVGPFATLYPFGLASALALTAALGRVLAVVKLRTVPMLVDVDFIEVCA